MKKRVNPSFVRVGDRWALLLTEEKFKLEKPPAEKAQEKAPDSEEPEA